MKREKVRDVKIHLEEKKTNNELEYINLDRLKQIIKIIIEDSKGLDGKLIYTKRDFKDSIYNLVINYFKRHRLYYLGLTLKLIRSQVATFEKDFLYSDSFDYKNAYDELCWRKVNGMKYDEELYKELRKKQINAEKNN
jgi:hypothetical protein